MRTLTCPVCGKTFTTDKPNKKYCCEKCQIKAQQMRHKTELMPIVCVICGKRVTPQFRRQRTCGCDECKQKYVAMYGRWHKCKLDVPDEQSESKPKRKQSKSAWNRLLPSTRYERMTLGELNEACLKAGMDYGQAQTAYYNGTLPQDFGKR